VCYHAVNILNGVCRNKEVKRSKFNLPSRNISSVDEGSKIEIKKKSEDIYDKINQSFPSEK
jgi:hypothetical protein